MHTTVRSRGLTLIELVIALAVLAVLATLALPSMGRVLGSQRLVAAAETLAADLREARFEAARSGQPVFVVAGSGEQGWCWSVARDSACPCGQPLACQLKTTGAADHAGVRLEDGLLARLEADGSASGAVSATFATRDGERLRVDLGPMGRPRVCRVGAAGNQRYPVC
jgi:type IV fimbrial biogenesis protein FimT